MAAQLVCPNCNASIQENKINIQRLVAKCSNCNAVFDFDEGGAKAVKRERSDIPLPKGFDLQQLAAELIIKISWRKTKHTTFWLIFTLIWDGITLPFVLIAIYERSWEIGLIISLHALVGIGVLIYTLALFMNSTSIDVSQHGIAIVSKPISLPFHPNRYIKSRDLRQLYVEQYVESRTNGNPNYAYSVRAVLEGVADPPKIIKGLKKEEQALFIEHEIEKYLQIENKPAF